MSKISLLSFADSRYANSLIRLYNQSIDFPFNNRFLFNENDLDPKFRILFSNKLKSKIKGYGFWSWKPQIILQALDLLPDEDLLLYLDAGCHLNINGLNRFTEYCDIVRASNSGILAFQASPPDSHYLRYDGRNLPDLVEYKWTKGDLFDFFHARNQPDITHTPTIGAGIIFIKKNLNSISLLSEWRKTFLTNFALIDDSKSKSDNFPDFVEHRYDQSIFSILAKINKVETVSAYEYWYPNIDSKGIDWQALSCMPIHVRRDLHTNFINRLNKFYYRILRYLLARLRGAL